jgi:hypothetical protein
MTSFPLGHGVSVRLGLRRFTDDPTPPTLFTTDRGAQVLFNIRTKHPSTMSTSLLEKKDGVGQGFAQIVFGSEAGVAARPIQRVTASKGAK